MLFAFSQKKGVFIYPQLVGFIEQRAITYHHTAQPTWFCPAPEPLM